MGLNNIILFKVILFEKYYIIINIFYYYNNIIYLKYIQNNISMSSNTNFIHKNHRTYLDFF